jgi:exopolysaccharide biosynthesis polyprenyl glycosylphosphotransferase
VSSTVSLSPTGQTKGPDGVAVGGGATLGNQASHTSAPSPLDMGRAGKLCRSNDQGGRRGMRGLLLVSDFCLVWGSAGAAMILLGNVRSVLSIGQAPVFPRGAAGFLLFFSVLIVLFAKIFGLYEIPWKTSLRSDLASIVKSVLSAAAITGACNYLFRIRVAPALSIASTIAASWISLSIWRAFIRTQVISGLTGNKNVLIVGCGPNGEMLRRHLSENPELGYVFKGYIDRRQKGRAPDPERNHEEADILGPAEDLPTIARKHFIDEVLISVPSDRYLIEKISLHARTAGMNVRIVPDLYGGLADGRLIEYVGALPTITINQSAIPTLQLVVKRFVDIVASVLLLILLAPFLFLIAAVIKLDSNGPVFYRSLRIGKKGKTFLCFKFRTMVTNAEVLRRQLEHLNERDGILFKIDADPRITRVGKMLRRFSLDEWPQLWNVLKQDMSLVGPRPSVPDEYEQYALNHLRRLDVTPGVTGLWQVTARRDPSFESYLALDKEYVNNWSLWLDCKILLKTFRVVLSGSGQ